jgi:hypothetical protein
MKIFEKVNSKNIAKIKKAIENSKLDQKDIEDMKFTADMAVKGLANTEMLDTIVRDELHGIIKEVI